MKKERFEARAAEMRQRMLAAQGTPPNPAGLALVGKGPGTPAEPTVNLQEAARRIGVSYATAGRLLANEPGVRRFSIATSGAVIYPDTPLKRGRRVRFTYVIPVPVIERVIRRMGGVAEVA